MAHTFRNLSFEDPGPAPGSAAGWMTAQNAVTEKFAEYGPLRPNGDADETFREGWNAEDFKLVFLGILIDLTPAAYHAGVGLDKEDFEQKWLGNDFFPLNHNNTVLSSAVFDGEQVESFGSFEGDTSRLGLGYPEMQGGADGIPLFRTAADRIEVDGFNLASRGFANGIAIFVRLSDGTPTGLNNKAFDVKSPNGVVGDNLFTDGPAITFEDGAAKTFITQEIEYEFFDGATKIAEDFDGTWTAMVGF